MDWLESMTDWSGNKTDSSVNSWGLSGSNSGWWVNNWGSLASS